MSKNYFASLDDEEPTEKPVAAPAPAAAAAAKKPAAAAAAPPPVVAAKGGKGPFAPKGSSFAAAGGEEAPYSKETRVPQSGRGGRGGRGGSAVDKGRRREKDHHVSGTGRDATAPKGGAGKGNWGTGIEPAAIAEGLTESPAAAPADGAAAAAADAPAAVEAEPEVVEEPDNTITLAQYQAAQAALRQGAGFEALPEPAAPAPVKGKKITEEDLPDELDGLVVEKKKGDQKKARTVKTVVDVSFRTPRIGGDDKEFRGGRGGGRGGFRGGRGGAEAGGPPAGDAAAAGAGGDAPRGAYRGRGGRGAGRGGERGRGAPRGGAARSTAAINVDDAAAFPTLG